MSVHLQSWNSDSNKFCDKVCNTLQPELMQLYMLQPKDMVYLAYKPEPIPSDNEAEE